MPERRAASEVPAMAPLPSPFSGDGERPLQLTRVTVDEAGKMEPPARAEG